MWIVLYHTFMSKLAYPTCAIHHIVGYQQVVFCVTGSYLFDFVFAWNSPTNLSKPVIHDIVWDTRIYFFRMLHIFGMDIWLQAYHPFWNSYKRKVIRTLVIREISESCQPKVSLCLYGTVLNLLCNLVHSEAVYFKYALVKLAYRVVLKSIVGEVK